MLFVYVLIAILFSAALLAVAGIQVVAGQRHAEESAVLWTLAIALEKQLPLTEELEALAETLSKPRAAKVRRVVDGLLHGDSPAEALRWVPGVIPNAAIVAAQVGEESGTLPAVLRAFAVRHARSGPVGDNALSGISLAYPVGLLLFVLFVLNGLMYYIVPKFKKIFEDFGFELPDVTKRIIEVSDVLNGFPFLYLLIVGPPLAVGGWAVRAYTRGWGEQDVWLVGRWFRRLDVPEVLRNLAAAVEAEHRPDDVLLLLSREHRRRAMRTALESACEKYRKGDDCWQALRGVGLLRAREVAALRSAERVGNLPWVLRQLAETIERRLANRWLTVLEIAQPVAVVSLGAIIAAIEVGFFSPLMSLILEHTRATVP